MASSLVVDANVVIKWFVDERDSKIARDLLNAPKSLIAPSHALGEIGHVLVRHRRAGRITSEQFAAIEHNVPAMLTLVSVEHVFGLALRIAFDTNASMYDALYVAVAESRDLPLVTADERLVAAVAGTAWHPRVIGLVDWTTA